MMPEFSQNQSFLLLFLQISFGYVDRLFGCWIHFRVVHARGYGHGRWRKHLKRFRIFQTADSIGKLLGFFHA